MTAAQKVGEPLPYKKLDRSKAKNIKDLRGIFKAWQKAPKFVLRLDASKELRMYLTVDGKLGLKAEAKKFASGFDDPQLKKDYWKSRLHVSFVVEHV